MADLAQQTIKLTADVLEKSAKTLEELTEAILQYILKHSNNKIVKQLADYQKNGGGLDYYNDSALDAKVIEDTFIRLGIPYAKFMGNDDSHFYFLARQCDRELIKRELGISCESEMFISMSNKIDFLKENLNKEIITLKDLSKEEVLDFINRAKAGKYKINVEEVVDTKTNKSTFNISTSVENEHQFMKSIDRNIINYSGISGEMQKHKDVTNIKENEKINNLLRDPSKVFYIVSAEFPAEYISVSKNGAFHYRGNKLIESSESFSRYNANFTKLVNEYIKGISRPIVLNEDEFSIHEDRRSSVILSKIKASNNKDSVNIDLDLKFKQLLILGLKNQKTLDNLANENESFEESINKTFDRDTYMSDDIKQVINELDNLDDESVSQIRELAKEVIERRDNIESKIDRSTVTQNTINSVDIDSLIQSMRTQENIAIRSEQQEKESKR